MAAAEEAPRVEAPRGVDHAVAAAVAAVAAAAAAVAGPMAEVATEPAFQVVAAGAAGHHPAMWVGNTGVGALVATMAAQRAGAERVVELQEAVMAAGVAEAAAAEGVVAVAAARVVPKEREAEATAGAAKAQGVKVVAAKALVVRARAEAATVEVVTGIRPDRRRV